MVANGLGEHVTHPRRRFMRLIWAAVRSPGVFAQRMNKARPPRRQPRTYRRMFEVLEPRIMLSASPLTGYSYDLVNVNSNLAATVANAAPGTVVTQQSNQSSPSQEWKFTALGGTAWEITNNSDGLALGVTGGSGSSGATVDEEAYTGSASQRWSVNPSGAGYAITNVNGNLLLDVSGASSAAGAPLVEDAASGAASQTWQLAALPSGWADQDIGSVPTAGTADFNGTTYTVSGAGGDISVSQDGFNFAGENFTGDGQIIAQVNAQTSGKTWAKAGVMFRNDNTAGSIFADVVVTPGAGLLFEYRSLEGGLVQSVQVTGITAPGYVKLTRVGNTFGGYYSADGSTWSSIGMSQTLPMGSTALAGLAVTSFYNSTLNTATFSDVSVGVAAAPGAAVTGLTAAATGSGPINVSWTDSNPAGTVSNYLVQRSTDGIHYQTISSVPAGTTSYTDSVLQAGTGYDYQVVAENIGSFSAASTVASAAVTASSLPAPWNTAQVGTAQAGSAGYSSGQWTLTGAGEVAPNIAGGWFYVGGTQDRFQYAYQALGSNGQISAQVNSLTGSTVGGVQAGLMLRATGDPGSAFAGIFITSTEGVEFLARGTQGAYAPMQADISYAPPTAGAPVYLKLTTTGDQGSQTVTGYISTDGINWSQIGQSTVDLGAAPTAGLLATSNSSTNTQTATFSGVSVGIAATVNAVPQTAQSIHTEVYSGSDGRVVWRPIPAAATITVEQSTDGTNWATVGVIPGTADTWLPTGLMPGTTYYYRLQSTNANGSSPWSPTVSLTTLATAADPASYQVVLGPDTYVKTGSDDVMQVQDSAATAPADSWQQAMLLGAGGTAENISLGQTATIGNFTAAGGAGYYGNSYGFNVDATGLAFDDTAQNFYYNQNQTDHHQNSSWLSFSITLTDTSNSSNTLTEAAGAAAGEFVMGVNPSTGGAAFNLDLSNLEFGGPDYPTTPDIIWDVNGSTAAPSSGDFVGGPNPTVTLSFSNDYSFRLTAGVALYGGSSTIDTSKPEATVNVDVLHIDQIEASMVGQDGQVQSAYSIGETGLQITDSNVSAIPENASAEMEFSAQTLAGLPSNNSAALSKLGWYVQRNAADNPALGTAAPQFAPVFGDPTTGYLDLNMPGSFKVIAYADVAGGGWQASETLCVFHLAIVGMEITQQDVAPGTGPITGLAAVRPSLNNGVWTFFAPQDRIGNAIAAEASPVTLIGGGADETLGVDQMRVGWLQNLVTNTVSMQYGASGTVTGSYPQLNGTILDAGPATSYGAGANDFMMVPGAQTAAGTNVIQSVGEQDSPAVQFDQSFDGAAAESLSGSWGFTLRLTMFSTGFDAFYSSFWNLDWHVGWIAKRSGTVWTNAIDVVVSSSSAIVGGGSPGVTAGPAADSLLDKGATYTD